MKLKPIFMTSVFVASSFFVQAQGVSEEMQGMVVYGHAQQSPQPTGVLYEPEQRFTEFVGMGVWNFQNEKLGKIKFITADLENARLVEVVITSGGGFLGRGERTISVPPGALKFDAAGQIARLNMSKARFDAASRFDTADVAAYSNSERVAAVSRYFGQAPLLRMGHVQKVESIVNMQIKNTRGQYLGKVKTLMMNLHQGRILYIVDDTEAMGSDGAHILQPQALRYNAARNGLVLDETFAELKNEPRFKWSTSRGDSFQKESYATRLASTNPVRQSEPRAISVTTRATTASRSLASSTRKTRPQTPSKVVAKMPGKMLASTSSAYSSR